MRRKPIKLKTAMKETPAPKGQKSLLGETFHVLCNDFEKKDLMELLTQNFVFSKILIQRIFYSAKSIFSKFLIQKISCAVFLLLSKACLKNLRTPYTWKCIIVSPNFHRGLFLSFSLSCYLKDLFCIKNTYQQQ